MKSKRNVRRMTELALLMAIVLIMAFTPLGYLHTPWGVSVTFIVIPVAVGSVVLGPGAGAFLGLVFGLTSFANAFQSATGALMLQATVPGTFVGSVVPRVLVGLIPGLICKALQHAPKLRPIKAAVCCFLTPVLNTAFYIVTSWLIFSETWLDIAAAAGYTGDTGIRLLGFMLGMVAANGIAEAVTCLLIGTAVCKALLKSLHKDDPLHG